MTADVDGSLGEKLQDIRDNVGASDINAQSPFTGISSNNNVLSPAWFMEVGQGTVIVSNGNTLWDSTIGAQVFEHSNGTDTEMEEAPPSNLVGFLHPHGPGGAQPTFDWNGGAIGIRPPSGNTLVVEFWMQWANVVTVTNNNGAGLCGSTDFRASASQLYMLRTVNGWELASSDGSTRTSQAEASDTSDGNWHVFRIEWQTTEARLYVDGTLKVTKSTNLPDFTSSTFNTFMSTFRVGADSGEPTGAWRWRAVALYWKTV